MSIEGVHSYRFGFLRSEQWKNVRIEALAREKGRCQICEEESISNDAHHLWYPENIYETTSAHLVILCRPCHDFIHAMVPDCKTRDEQEGREHWAKFFNAIHVWRTQKVRLFQAGGLEGGIHSLRAALKDYRQKNQDLLRTMASLNVGHNGDLGLRQKCWIAIRALKDVCEDKNFPVDNGSPPCEKKAKFDSTANA